MRFATIRFLGDSFVVLTTVAMAFACASLVACGSHAPADEQVMATAQPTQVAINALEGMEPRPPLDETPITADETVGAKDDSYLGRMTAAALAGQ